MPVSAITVTTDHCPTFKQWRFLDHLRGDLPMPYVFDHNDRFHTAILPDKPFNVHFPNLAAFIFPADRKRMTDVVLNPALDATTLKVIDSVEGCGLHGFHNWCLQVLTAASMTALTRYVTHGHGKTDPVLVALVLGGDRESLHRHLKTFSAFHSEPKGR